MKLLLKNSGMSTWLLITSLVVLLGCNTKKDIADTKDTYTCPMHPTVMSDKPGACPVCGMDLVRKTRTGEEVKITEDLAKLLQSPDQSIIASIKTIKAEFRKMRLTAEAHGVVTYDSRYTHVLPARMGGRLEHVFLRYAFQPVRKGQKVAEIYSPELLTAQRELLFLTTNDVDNVALITSAKEKLFLLGATTVQVDDLLRTKATTGRFTIYSPYDGYVILSNATMPATTAGGTPVASSGMGGGTGSATATPVSTQTPSTSILREGDYVVRGQTLFTIASSTALRAELNVPSAVAGSLHVGDAMSISFGGEVEEAKVDFIQPFFAEGEEFLKVRVYTHAQNLHIGQLVDATIHRMSAEALWLPNEAIMDMGSDRIVFVKTRGVFKAQTIVTGARSDGWTEIKKGIASADEIAAKASYLVDSESFVRSN